MGSVVYKYQVPQSTSFELKLPKKADVLYLGMQNGTPYMWVRHKKGSNKKELRRFVNVGTGDEFDTKGKKYIGTFQVEGGVPQSLGLSASGEFVGHLFEVTS